MKKQILSTALAALLFIPFSLLAQQNKPKFEPEELANPLMGPDPNKSRGTQKEAASYSFSNHKTATQHLK